MPIIGRAAAIAAATLIALAAAIAPEAAHADELSDLQAQAAQVSEDIDAAQQKLDEASRDYGDALACEEEARRNAQEARDKQAEIEGELDKIRNRMSRRAVSLYKSDPATLIDLCLSASSFNEAVEIVTMMNKLDDYDRELRTQNEQLAEEWRQHEKDACINEEIAARNKELAQEAETEAQNEIDHLEELYDEISDEVASIIYENQLATAYSSTPAVPNGSGGTDWSGVRAPEDANDIVARAYSALGSDYVWGGVGNGGYDCSGLVSYCVSGEHARIGTTTTFMGYEQTNDPQPGDIVTSSGHCGIYIGDGQMIHASDYGTGVIIGNVQSDMIAVKP